MACYLRKASSLTQTHKHVLIRLNLWNTVVLSSTLMICWTASWWSFRCNCFAFWSMLAEVVMRWAWPPALHAPGLICVMVLLESGASEASCHVRQYLHGRLNTWILERDAAASVYICVSKDTWMIHSQLDETIWHEQAMYLAFRVFQEDSWIWSVLIVAFAGKMSTLMTNSPPPPPKEKKLMVSETVMGFGLIR